MAYKRKTKDVWEVQQKVRGKWVCLCTKGCMMDAHDKGKEYEKADPKGKYRIMKIRKRVDSEGKELAADGV